MPEKKLAPLSYDIVIVLDTTALEAATK